MAFNFKRANNTGIAVPTTIQMPAKADESYVVGEALKVSDGAVTKCTGTTKPEYIAAEKKTAKAGDTLSVMLVEDNQEYVTTASSSGTFVVGTAYTIHTDGLQITTTTSSGVAKVVDVDGANITVKF